MKHMLLCEDLKKFGKKLIKKNIFKKANLKTKYHMS
jgi:hypothetical protein